MRQAEKGREFIRKIAKYIFHPGFFFGRGSVILHILQRVGAEISSVCLQKKGERRSSNPACEIFLALARN